LNPFSPQHPAQPEYFADRKTELDDFRITALNSAKLETPAPLNYVILGTWGQGKTSMLYKFRQMVLEDLQKEIKCICIYYPLSPQSCRDWGTFSTDFLQTVKSTASATGSKKLRIVEAIRKWEVSLNLGPVGMQRRINKEPPSMLDALQTLWEKYLEPSKIQIVFILLDDLHYFPIRAEESAYLTLRTTFQELVNRKCNYSLVVTAHSLLFSNIADLAEPVTRFFERIDLKPFTFNETKEAINVRLDSIGSKIKVDDEVIESIVKKTEGQPYLIMFIMYKMLTILKGVEVIRKDSFDRSWPNIEDSLDKAIFGQKFQSASERERELMIEIGKANKELVSPMEFRNFKGVRELFSRLEQKELLLRHERGKYSLFHPLFSEFLRRR